MTDHTTVTLRGTRLSPHFMLAEMTRSQWASRHGVPNIPDDPVIIENLRQLCDNVLEPLRELAGTPIVVSSGYRSPRVNRAVGGAKQSQHMLGEAADITALEMSTKALFDVLRFSGIPFDQLINEFDYAWVHVSYRRERLRRQVLAAVRTAKGTVYRPQRLLEVRNEGT